jgi:hypothetical protein
MTGASRASSMRGCCVIQVTSQVLPPCVDNDGSGWSRSRSMTTGASSRSFGKPWLGKAELLTHANGDAIDQLVVPFHGCPC